MFFTRKEENKIIDAFGEVREEIDDLHDKIDDQGFELKKKIAATKSDALERDVSITGLLNENILKLTTLLKYLGLEYRQNESGSISEVRKIKGSKTKKTK